MVGCPSLTTNWASLNRPTFFWMSTAGDLAQVALQLLLLVGDDQRDALGLVGLPDLLPVRLALLGEGLVLHLDGARRPAGRRGTCRARSAR